MNYCNSCFALIQDENLACPQCNTPLASAYDVSGVLGAGVTSAPERIRRPQPPPVVKANSPRRLLFVSFSIAASLMALVILVDQNREARASANPQSQLVQQQHKTRRVELIRAIDELEQLHRDVKRNEALAFRDRTIRADENSDFRSKLNHIKEQYRLYGEISQTRLNARAEDGLRNATLYLSSLERSLLARESDETIAGHERALVKSLQVARASLN